MDFAAFWDSIAPEKRVEILKGLMILEENGFFHDLLQRHGQNILGIVQAAGNDSGGMKELERSAVSWAALNSLCESLRTVLNENYPT